MSLRNPKGLLAVSSFQDLVPPCHENISGELANIGLVINDEDCRHGALQPDWPHIV